MTPRPFFVVAFCIVSPSATLGVACAVVPSSSVSAAAGTTVYHSSPDAAEDAATAPLVLADASPIPSNPVQGNPLCNASPAGGISSCFPDDPSSAQACRIAPDGGVYDPTTDYDGGVLGCHVVAEAGMLSAPTAACLPSGLGTDGNPCHLSTDCAPTLECVGTGSCRRYCCSDPCDPSHFCDIQPETQDPALTVPVCMPIQPCGLFDSPDAGGSCGSDATCAAIVATNGTPLTTCVEIGLAQAGDSCDSQHCAEDLVCTGNWGERLCRRLCHTEADAGDCAPSETCMGGLPFFLGSAVGLCESTVGPDL